MKLTNKLFQASSCLLCLIVMWKYGFVFIFAGTEASGGALTGPLENLYDIGFLLLLIALFLALFYPRIAAAITVLASLLCLPLDLYFTAPGLFRRVFTGMYWESSIRSNFVWNHRAIFGVLTLAIAVFIALSNLGSDHAQPSKA